MKAAEQNPPATNNRKIPIVIPIGVPSKVCRAVAIPLQTNTWLLLIAATTHYVLLHFDQQQTIYKLLVEG